MSLPVALDFADNPRPHHTLQAPADTNGELYQALAVLAAEVRRLRDGLQLIATDKHRLMNVTARQTAELILGGKPIGFAPEPDGVPVIEIGTGKVRMGTAYSQDDPDKVQREIVVYDDGGEYKPVGTSAYHDPTGVGVPVDQIGKLLVRLRIADAKGAVVFMETVVKAIENAAIADHGYPSTTKTPQHGLTCDWTRLQDTDWKAVEDGLQPPLVQFRTGCSEEIAQGMHPIYPDDCPRCGRKVLIRQSGNGRTQP
jgi:hypothetical protein